MGVQQPPYILFLHFSAARPTTGSCAATEYEPDKITPGNALSTAPHTPRERTPPLTPPLARTLTPSKQRHTAWYLRELALASERAPPTPALPSQSTGARLHSTWTERGRSLGDAARGSRASRPLRLSILRRRTSPAQLAIANMGREGHRVPLRWAL